MPKDTNPHGGRKGTYIYGLSERHTELLREAAAIFGYRLTRGPGSGVGGSMAGLLEALMIKYEEQPDRVLHLLGVILGRPWQLPGKYREDDA